MTEVAGPPAPPARFSSLPIRGADAASTAGADGSGLEANCSMAQAFRNPHGKPGQRPGGVFPMEPSQLPRHAFQIPAPRPARQPDRQEKYGAAPASPQAHGN